MRDREVNGSNSLHCLVNPFFLSVKILYDERRRMGSNSLHWIVSPFFFRCRFCMIKGVGWGPILCIV